MNLETGTFMKAAELRVLFEDCLFLTYQQSRNLRNMDTHFNQQSWNLQWPLLEEQKNEPPLG